MENFNSLDDVLMWLTWGNIFFLAAVFILGWLAGIATFFCVLTKYIG